MLRSLLSLHWRPGWSSRLLNVAQYSPEGCGHFGTKTINGKSLPFSFKQVKIFAKINLTSRDIQEINEMNSQVFCLFVCFFQKIRDRQNKRDFYQWFILQDSHGCPDSNEWAKPKAESRNSSQVPTWAAETQVRGSSPALSEARQLEATLAVEAGLDPRQEKRGHKHQASRVAF